ncbi:SRR1-like protein isoform X1 [Halichoerus grypus]
MAAAAEPWQAVAPRRRRRSAARRPREREAPARDPEGEPQADCGVVLRRIREAGEDLLLSDFWSLALETINGCLTKHLEQLKAPEGTLPEALGNLHLDSSPDGAAVTPGSIPGESPVPGTCRLKCVCYGIGNFATCVIARHQLTFLLLFLEKCQIPRRQCWVYDPLFSQLEIAVLNALGVTALSENEADPKIKHCWAHIYSNSRLEPHRNHPIGQPSPRLFTSGPALVAASHLAHPLPSVACLLPVAPGPLTPSSHRYTIRHLLPRQKDRLGDKYSDNVCLCSLLLSLVNAKGERASRSGEPAPSVAGAVRHQAAPRGTARRTAAPQTPGDRRDE